MFCPGCGSEQQGQYCRSCGKDLRLVRTALENPDALTAAASARDEIGRAVADKIREVKSAKELSKVVEEVLPQLESFLESPEERRFRRIRAGTITAAIGLGATLAFVILSFAAHEEGLLFVAGLGATIFLIGLGLMLNGWHFTAPKNQSQAPLPDRLTAVTPESLPTQAHREEPEDLLAPSATEHTTHQLPDRQLRRREAQLE